MNHAENSRAQSSNYGTLNSNSYSHQSLIHEPIFQQQHPHHRSKCSRFSRFLGFSFGKEEISNIRRTFLLLVLFDLIISTVLWLIYTEISELTCNKPPCQTHDFYNEVVKYTIKRSLFDTVMLAVFRFVTLELFYALLKCSKPWVVAVTTFVSSGFLVAKVILFLYDKDGKSSAAAITVLEILDFVLLITSLVLSWVETWVLDLKVLPRERRDRERESTADRTHNTNHRETSPLLHRVRTEEEFHSPVNTPDARSLASDSGSEDDRSFHTVGSSRSRGQSLTSVDEAELYLEKVNLAEQYALRELAADDWTKSQGSDEVRGVVYTKTTSQYGKIFKLVAELDIDPLLFYNDQIENVERMPEWNPTVSEQRVLEKVDDHTDIVYNVGAEQVGGMVSSRDFVFLRHYTQMDGSYLISSVNVEYPTMPKQKKHVRGEQGPGIIKLMHAGERQTRMEWLLNTNLKGWLPQYAIDQALSVVLMSQLENMRKHCVVIQTP